MTEKLSIESITLPLETTQEIFNATLLEIQERFKGFEVVGGKNAETGQYIISILGAYIDLPGSPA